ncbi:MAG: ABC transporter ATP-binding protein [Anaerolineae bacterium]|nr:ABC transporter ATP-binding protein [Anaerolineae bacterium]
MSIAHTADRIILEVHQLVAGYGKSEVLHGVSLEVAAGEIVTMVGANGAGKSTLLRSIFGLTDIHSGVIRFKGKPITGLPPHAITAYGLALVPQERNVFPSLTVRENLEMGGFTVDRATLEERIERVFERFPRLRERQRQKAGTLSGGERQMLAIGRGLMTSPELLMLDEPSLGLAPKVVEALFEQIRLIHESGTTVFLVEQNARRALAIADRAYVLELGRIRHQGSGQELLNDPEVQRAYLGG